MTAYLLVASFVNACNFFIVVELEMVLKDTTTAVVWNFDTC